MKMMKRIASLALALCVIALAALMSSCGEGKKNAFEEIIEQVTAYSLTSKAVEKTRSLDSFDATLDVNISSNIAGVDVAVPLGTKVKAAGLKGSAPVYYSGTGETVFGSATESFYEGEWCYTVTAGVGSKQKIEGGGAVCEGVTTINSIQQVLPAMLLVDVTIGEDENGLKTVSVPIPDDKFEEIFRDFVNEMSVETVNGALEGVAEITSYRGYNAVVRITVSENGYVKSYAINFDLDVTADVTVFVFKTTTTFTSNVDAVLTYTDPGTPATITFPEGYRDFPETK